MIKDVRDVLMTEYARQLEDGFNKFVVDGYINFIFKSRHNNPLRLNNVNRVNKRIIRDANMEEVKLALEENREPILLPDFSVTTLDIRFVQGCVRMNLIFKLSKRLWGIEIFQLLWMSITKLQKRRN